MRTGFRHDRATHRTASKLGLLLLLPAVAVGCSDQSLPTASTSPAGPPALSTGANPVVLSASGSGHANLDGGWRTFSFTAQKRADGTTTGQIQFRNRGNGTASHGEIFCLNTVGEGIYAIAARGTNRLEGGDPGPFPPLPPAVLPDDWGMLFAVRDNGEGAGAAPDQFSQTANTTLFFAGLGCTNPAALGFTPAVVESLMSPVEAGNIQVND